MRTDDSVYKQLSSFWGSESSFKASNSYLWIRLCVSGALDILNDILNHRAHSLHGLFNSPTPVVVFCCCCIRRAACCIAERVTRCLVRSAADCLLSAACIPPRGRRHGHTRKRGHSVVCCGSSFHLMWILLLLLLVLLLCLHINIEHTRKRGHSVVCCGSSFQS